MKCLYQLIDLERLNLTVDSLPDLPVAAERTGFAGLNITHPCKQAVLRQLTEASDDARALGAVNTIVLRAGRRSGHNTDWLAFREAVRTGLPGAATRRIVQLGAGGGGSATAYAALKLGANHIDIVDTEPGRAEGLADRLNRLFGDRIASASTDVAEAFRWRPNGLIHATPTGMHGHEGLPLPAPRHRAHRPRLGVSRG